MMHDAITERGGADLALLGFVDEEMGVRAGGVDVVAQFVLQVHQMVGQPVFKRGRSRVAAFAP